MNTYGPLFAELYGVVAPEEPAFRHIDHPSIEPTADGWVGFATIANQQFKDFLVLIERGDLLADEALVDINVRTKRAEEFEAAVQAWTTRHPTEEIIERASELRVPVAPIGDGATVVRPRAVRRPGRVRRRPPRPPAPDPLPAGRPPGHDVRAGPAAGRHTGTVDWDPRPAPTAADPGPPAPRRCPHRRPHLLLGRPVRQRDPRRPRRRRRQGRGRPAPGRHALHQHPAAEHRPVVGVGAGVLRHQRRQAGHHPRPRGRRGSSPSAAARGRGRRRVRELLTPGHGAVRPRLAGHPGGQPPAR